MDGGVSPNPLVSPWTPSANKPSYSLHLSKGPTETLQLLPMG
jgi:hypothetical protein